MKILTTAIFSVLMLGKQLSSQKWISLVILVVGVALVQFNPDAVVCDPLLRSPLFCAFVRQ